MAPPIKPQNYDESRIFKSTTPNGNIRYELKGLTPQKGVEGGTYFNEDGTPASFNSNQTYFPLTPLPEDWRDYYLWSKITPSTPELTVTPDKSYLEHIDRELPSQKYIIGNAGEGQFQQNRADQWRQRIRNSDKFVSRGWGSRAWGELGWNLGKGAALSTAFVFNPIGTGLGMLGANTGSKLFDNLLEQSIGQNWNQFTSPFIPYLNQYLPEFISRDIQEFSNPGAFFGAGYTSGLIPKVPQGSALNSVLPLQVLEKLRIKNNVPDKVWNWITKNYDKYSNNKLSAANNKKFNAYLDEVLGKNNAKQNRLNVEKAQSPIIKSGVEGFQDWNIENWFKDSARQKPATDVEKATFRKHIIDEYLQLTKDLIDRGELIRKDNQWYGKNINGEMEAIPLNAEQEYVVSRSKAYEENWTHPGFKYRSGVSPEKLQRYENNNTKAPYLTNTGGVFSHYVERDWQNNAIKGGTTVHISYPKNLTEEIFKGNPGSTSNNFYGNSTIQDIFNQSDSKIGRFQNYLDIPSKKISNETIVLDPEVTFKFIRGNDGNFDPSKGAFSYNYNDNNNNYYIT